MSPLKLDTNSVYIPHSVNMREFSEEPVSSLGHILRDLCSCNGQDTLSWIVALTPPHWLCPAGRQAEVAPGQHQRETLECPDEQAHASN